MLIHEIGFLILTGALGCWTVDPPCASPKTIDAFNTSDLKAHKIQLAPKDLKEFKLQEVHYEVSGIPVYEEKNDWIKIRKNSGEYFWINVSQNLKTFPDSIQFERIEKILTESLLSGGVDFEKELRSEDLKTPVVINSDVKDKIRKQNLETWMKQNKVVLPKYYLGVSLPCKNGTCTPFPQVNVHANPDSSSPLIFKAVLSWAHLDGEMIFSTDPNFTQERILGYDKNNDWLKVIISYNKDDKKEGWISLKNLPHTSLSSVTPEQSLSDFIKRSESQGNPLGSDLKAVQNSQINFGIEATGKSKWLNGQLWMEVDVKDNDQCSGSAPKSLQKGWLPYKKSNTEEPVLGWVSRGC